MSEQDNVLVPRDLLAAACHCVRKYAGVSSETYRQLSVLSLSRSLAAQSEPQGVNVLVEWIVELARRDVARTQTDFVGRMIEAMGRFEAVCDEYPDGEWPEHARDDAGENLAALAGLALAQLAIVQDGPNALKALARPLPEPQVDDGWREEIRQEIINTPETADFMAGVPIEAAHQRDRWGSDHDAGKTPFDWFWLIGYLAQKAATSQAAGDLVKAQHHTISTAAALANWHAQISGFTDMRPGIGPNGGGEKPGSAYDLASRLAASPAPPAKTAEEE